MVTNKELDDAMREHFRKLGAAGGKKGGAARWAGVSKKARSRAMKAVRAKGKVKE